MTVFLHPTRGDRVDEAAVEAVRLGRLIAETWPDAEVEHAAHLDQVLLDTISRLASGEVFDSQDDLRINQMVTAVCATLDDYQAGYGAFLARAWTGEKPFADAAQEAVRDLGEALKSLRVARATVVNAILAERQLAALRRRR